MNSRSAHYLRRHTIRLERILERLEARSSRLVRWRLLTAVLGIAGIVTGFTQVSSAAGWVLLLLTVGTLALLATFHRRVHRGIRRHRIWREIKRTHLARLELDWDGIPTATAIELPPEHPFGRDLDLFGDRSLHRLLDCSLSDGGSRYLAQLLLAEKPHQQQILARQELVAELRPHSGFRDRLALEGALIARGRERWPVTALQHWLDLPQSEFVAGVILLSWLLCFLNWGLLAVFLIWKVLPLWILSGAIYLALQFYWQGNVEASFKGALSLEHTISQVRGIFSYLENHDFSATPAAARLCDVFNDPDRRPSRQIQKLEGWISALSVRGFPLAWLLCNLILPWDLLALARLEEARRRCRNHLVNWLDVWFRLEAITSLATFADLHRDYAFPQIELSAGHLLRARAMGHPLIRGEERVDNDFELQSPGQVVIITGSNMSGKSTFLRTIGVNARLAYAGAPVCARELALSVFRIWAIIRVDDSLSDGYSFFYREVQRLKALLGDLQNHSAPTILYLIDEIFRGTNNRERLIGSRSYIRALCRNPCMGVVTTHDLDLVRLEEESDRISNAHFREHIESGRMHFDYKLHPGPCPTTNALEIMRMEGLPVDEPGG